jgi:hypothetical protein
VVTKRPVSGAYKADARLDTIFLDDTCPESSLVLIGLGARLAALFFSVLHVA